MNDEPTRGELERALRRVHLELAQLRGQFLEMAAQLVAVTNALDAAGASTEGELTAESDRLLAALQAHDASSNRLGVELDGGFEDKYELPELDIPCAELMHLCEARCCTLRFSLSPQDLDEGVARWDYGDPYRNLRAVTGYCTHCEPTTRACAIYAQRPAPCRRFDCRGDDRIWADYDARIPASTEQRAAARARDTMTPVDDALERVARQRTALTAEALSLRARDDD